MLSSLPSIKNISMYAAALTQVLVRSDSGGKVPITNSPKLSVVDRLRPLLQAVAYLQTDRRRRTINVYQIGPVSGWYWKRLFLQRLTNDSLRQINRLRAGA